MWIFYYNSSIVPSYGRFYGCFFYRSICYPYEPNSIFIFLKSSDCTIPNNKKCIGVPNRRNSTRKIDLTSLLPAAARFVRCGSRHGGSGWSSRRRSVHPGGRSCGRRLFQFFESPRQRVVVFGGFEQSVHLQQNCAAHCCSLHRRLATIFSLTRLIKQSINWCLGRLG